MLVFVCTRLARAVDVSFFPAGSFRQVGFPEADPVVLHLVNHIRMPQEVE